MNQPNSSHWIALVAVALAWAGVTPAPAQAPRWRLVWEDQFDAFDPSVWRRVESNEPTNHSLHAYLPEQVSVEAGRLVITSEDRPHAGLAYRSGQIISRAEQRYGRWEVHAKLPAGRGMWPAIWLLPDVDKHRWPSGGEIDLLENRGAAPYRAITSSAFHYGTNPPYRHEFALFEQSTAVDGLLVNYQEGFHTYAVDWTPRQVRFYVDGVCHAALHDDEVGGFFSEKCQPMQLVINTAVGGDFLPDPDASTVWPQRMEVDWVRVYELDEEPEVVGFRNGGFDHSLAGWRRFGTHTSRIQNAQATNEVSLEGERSLKLFGAFGAGARYTGVSQGVTVRAGSRVDVSASVFVAGHDSLAGTSNRALMKVEFYGAFGARYGEQTLEEEETLLADAQTPSDRWVRRRLTVAAPDGAVEARLALLFDQPSKEAGAVFIDRVDLTVQPAQEANTINTVPQYAGVFTNP